MTARPARPDTLAPVPQSPPTPRRLTPPPPSGGTTLSELDSLRGWAMLLVFLFHADGWIWTPRGRPSDLAPTPLSAFLRAGHTGVSLFTPLSAFLRAGHTGVSLFFVLSAFLLSRPFLREIAGGSRVDRRRFFVRRALRILPAYWATVVVATLATATTVAGLASGVPHLLFLTGLGPRVAPPLLPWSGPWWSLATEVQFYVALPIAFSLLAPHGDPPRWERCVLVGLLLGALWSLPVFRSFHLSPGIQPLLAAGLPGRLPIFAAGIATAWVHERHGGRLRAQFSRLGHRLPVGDLLLVAVLVALGCLLIPVARDGYRLWEQPGRVAWHVPEGAAWAAVVLLVLNAPLRLRPLIHNPALRWIGLLSYSIYLVHQPILYETLILWRTAVEPDTFGWDLPSFGWLGVASIAILAISVVSYRCVELPFLRRKSRVT